MGSGGYGPAIRQVERLLEGGGTAVALGEAQLLRRFADHRDGAAFEALVGRHGPMVLGTCRRMLADPHDVEDAFQATFLVLARKAGSIRDGDRLGPWLHGVARRVATRSRALAARRNARERTGVAELAVAEADTAEALEVRSALDEELARLPEKYRAPLVLCYLEGLTHDEAARQLSWPVGTVRSRLAGGRDRLRSRLTRRGLAPSAAVPGLLPAVLPTHLVDTTVRIATLARSAPAHVASLAKGALIAMMWSKMKAVAALGLMAGLTVGGAGALAQQGGDGKSDAPDQVPAKPTRAELIKSWEQVLRREAELKSAQADFALLKQRAGISQDPSPASVEAVPPTPASKQTVKQVQDERELLRQALIAANRRVEELQFQRARLDKQWKQLVAQGDVDAAIAKPARPDVTPPEGPAPVPATPARAADPFAPTTEPTVMTIPGRPTLFAVISPGCDRVTMIDSVTRNKATFRIPGGATQVTPISDAQSVSLIIKGREIRRVGIYDRKDGRWSEHDLGEPATEVMPLTGPTGLVGFSVKAPEVRRLLLFDTKDGTWAEQPLREPARGPVGPMMVGSLAQHQIGRFVYVYSQAAKKWSVLELKREDSAQPGFGNSGLVDGRIMVPDGDLIHLYDPRTGEWTHIDTKDEP